MSGWWGSKKQRRPRERVDALAVFHPPVGYTVSPAGAYLPVPQNISVHVLPRIQKKNQVRRKPREAAFDTDSVKHIDQVGLVLMEY